MFHYYDTDTNTWKSIENPTRDDIARALSMVRRPCQSCDADVEFTPGDPPDVVITHERDCPAA